MTIELGIMLTLIGGAISVATFFIGRQSAAKSEGKQAGTLESDVSYIKKTVDELKLDLKEANIPYMKSAIETLKKENEEMKESIRRIHDRIDEIK